MAGTDSARAALRRAMNDRLDTDELRTVCYDLGVSYDNLSGDTKLARIISLLERLERREQGAHLVAWLRENRSDYPWPDPFQVPAPVARSTIPESAAPPQPQEPSSPPRRAATDPLVIESPIHLELVRVPAGKFLMGSDARQDPAAAEHEKPQHRVHLPEFLIGKYPVTIEQYAAFVKTTGHGDWRGPQSRRMAHHPVTHVNWYDALTFCDWLTEVTGQTFRLPTEAEWEKAARGTDGRLYPWGNEAPEESLCTFGDMFGHTTSVTRHPAGVSPYGAFDMAGNVDEWTSSLWGQDWQRAALGYPYNAQDGREDPSAAETVLRVYRGGSYIKHPDLIRCACRFRVQPKYSGQALGFRVAVSTTAK